VLLEREGDVEEALGACAGDGGVGDCEAGYGGVGNIAEGFIFVGELVSAGGENFCVKEE
jgi:hypothetical protein